MKLEGKVAVVTGGGSGIGEAICVRFAREGARVGVVDLNEQAAKLTADLAGGGVAVVADVSDSAAVDAALERVEGELGPVDIWVNNAGIAGTDEYTEHVNERALQQIGEAASGTITTPLEAFVRMSDEEWRRMLSVHLDGTFYGMRAAARSMVKRGAGAIVNIGSICGLEGCTGHPHYSAAKSGIHGLTRTVAKELILQGVRVNAIAPGYIDTPLIGAMSETLTAVVRLQTPMGRLGRPDEIAATAAFLASDDASFFVGQIVSPNGGVVTV
jgi:3-oxoacyl-[acyl-carrier protein] reductase